MTAKRLASKVNCSLPLIYMRAEELEKEGHAERSNTGREWIFYDSAIEYLRTRRRKQSAKKEG